MVSHKSLKAWQEAEWVSSMVIDLSRSQWKPYAQAVFSQLQRASLSTQINIAEGYSFTNSPTFARHLSIAYGSSIETGELLELLAKKRLIPEDDAKKVVARCHNSQKLILGLLKRCRQVLQRPCVKGAPG
jgi:four helix bundle protein